MATERENVVRDVMADLRKAQFQSNGNKTVIDSAKRDAALRLAENNIKYTEYANISEQISKQQMNRSVTPSLDNEPGLDR